MLVINTKNHLIGFFQALVFALIIMFASLHRNNRTTSTVLYFLRTIIIVATLLVSCQVDVVKAHGNGAPKSRCDSMTPGHWASVQKSLSPYQVLVDKTMIRPGDRVNITLKTVPGQTGFKGFFVMVKEADRDEHGNKTGDSSSKNLKNFGVFDLETSDKNHSQPVHCFDQRDSAMTHVINYVKNSVELFWIAPKLISDEEQSKGIAQGNKSSVEKELRVVATFVRDFWTYWTNVEPVGNGNLILTDTYSDTKSHPKFQSTTPNALVKVSGAKPVVTVVSSSSSMSSSSSSIPGQGNRQISLSVLPSSSSIPGQGNRKILSSAGTAADGNAIPLDEDSSWNHFKRAWSYMVDMLGSRSSPSS